MQPNLIFLCIDVELHFDVFLADLYYFIAYIRLLYAVLSTVPISLVDILPSPSISK